MQNFKCPNCQQPTIGFWRRQIIGPTAPAVCPNCEAEVAITWASYWTMIPFIVLWGISEFVDSSALYWALNTVGLISWLWLSNQCVPLIVKSRPAAASEPSAPPAA
jgi:hypothetical protein